VMCGDIKTIALLLPLALVGTPQDPPTPKDPPKVTYEDSGEFRLLAKDLEFKFGGRIFFGRKIASKEVSLSVKDAGFYEVLDALCRAHKEVTYFAGDEVGPGSENLTVVEGTWVEYPASYHGHFKTALVALMKTTRSSPEGDARGVEAELVVFGPPWLPLSWTSGAEAEWKIEEIRDAEGRDLVLPEKKGPAEERIRIQLDMHRSGNFKVYTTAFREFDLDRGLKSLAGKVELRTVESRPVRLTLDVGESAEIPQGKVKIAAVKEMESAGEDTSWMITMTFTPNEASKDLKLQRIIGRRARFDNDRGQSARVEIPWRSLSFDIELPHAKRIPKWIELNVRAAERVFDIPFRFADVAFRGK
jgi:hypothetical protein